MSNVVDAANGALWALIETLFADATLVRNPDAHLAPRAKTDGLAVYVSMDDDESPEILAVLCGPFYDLKIAPMVTIAVVGKTKAERQVAARAAKETLAAALAADRYLGGAAVYADIDSANSVDGSNPWMAGGLEVGVGLLLPAAATKAG